jgi:catechol 2,3-dioxygenase-like lactoylglutathione lyase family enzyme
MDRVIRLATVTLVVRDYDEALRWFTNVLSSRSSRDTPLTGDKRWVVVGPPTARLTCCSQGEAERAKN